MNLRDREPFSNVGLHMPETYLSSNPYDLWRNGPRSITLLAVRQNEDSKMYYWDSACCPGVYLNHDAPNLRSMQGSLWIAEIWTRFNGSVFTRLGCLEQSQISAFSFGPQLRSTGPSLLKREGGTMCGSLSSLNGSSLSLLELVLIPQYHEPITH